MKADRRWKYFIVVNRGYYHLINIPRELYFIFIDKEFKDAEVKNIIITIYIITYDIYNLHCKYLQSISIYMIEIKKLQYKAISLWY